MITAEQALWADRLLSRFGKRATRWYNSAVIEEDINDLLPEIMKSNREDDQKFASIIKKSFANLSLLPISFIICKDDSRLVAELVVKEWSQVGLLVEREGKYYDEHKKEVSLNKNIPVAIFATAVTDAEIVAPLLKQVSEVAWIKHVCCVLDYKLPIAEEQLRKYSIDKDSDIGIISVLTVNQCLEIGNLEDIISPREVTQFNTWQKAQYGEIVREVA